MSFSKPHALHTRRWGRNIGLALVLVAFVALVFALTVVKVTRGDPMQAFDHAPRRDMVPAAPAVSP